MLKGLSQHGLAVEKIVEKNQTLRIKFIPLEPVEHFIFCSNNGRMIEGFPIKINVFPNSDIFVVNENINGVRHGQKASFRICLNSNNDPDFNIKITSIFFLFVNLIFKLKFLMILNYF